MTISSNVRIAGPFVGTGAVGPFAFAFKVFQAADLYVVKLNVSSNVETVLTNVVDYTVTLNADQNINPGGTITLTAALAVGYNLTITSNIDYLQPVDLQNQGGYYPEVIESEFDRLTILIQQLHEDLEHSVTMPLSFSGSLDLPMPQAGYLLGWDPTGLALANIDPLTVASGVSTSFINTIIPVTASTSLSALGLTEAIVLKSGGFNVSAGQVLTIDVPFSAGLHKVFYGTGTVVGLKVVRPEWFGAVRDGVTNDSAALGTAIVAACNGALLFSAGTYAVSTTVVKTLTGPTRWICDGAPTIKWTGASAAYVMYLVLAGNQLSIDHRIVIDGNNVAAMLLRIDNDEASMATAVDLKIDNIKLINAYSDTAARNAFGMFIYGGFNRITINDPYVQNISRAAGLAGSPASQGISVSNKSVAVYARSVQINNPFVDTVLALDASGAGTYLNMDGICVIGPGANSNGGVKMDTILNVNGGTIINCHGRSIKCQMENNLIDGTTFIKNSAMTKQCMTSGNEVDFQYGSGVAVNCKAIYDQIAGGGTPWSASHAVIGASVRGYAAEEGALVVKNCTVTLNVPQATDKLPYFVTTDRTGGTVQSIIITDNTFLGEGCVNEFLLVSGGNVNRIVANNNYINDLGVSLIYSDVDYSSAIVMASGNYLAGAAKAITDGAAPAPPFYGSKNYGFSNVNNGMRYAAALNVNDGDVITHYMGGKPTAILVAASLGADMASVTAIGATTFTIAIKKHDGTPGAAQTVYWHGFI